MSPRSATSSRALAAFSVARTRSGLAGEDALGTRFEGAALQPDETADAALGDGEERVQPRAAEGHLLGRALHLHELAAAGHDDVHVHLGARVLGVAEVEHRLPLDDADADRGDAVTDRGRWLEPGDFRDRVGDRDEAARDGGGPCSAVRLDHVAVHPHRALAELGAVDDGAQGPADEPLDLLRSAARPAGLAGRARGALALVPVALVLGEAGDDGPRDLVPVARIFQPTLRLRVRHEADLDQDRGHGRAAQDVQLRLLDAAVADTERLCHRVVDDLREPRGLR